MSVITVGNQSFSKLLLGAGLTLSLTDNDGAATLSIGSDSGVDSVPSLAITGAAGAGFITLPAQSSDPAAGPTNTIRLFSDASNKFAWIGSSGYFRKFDGTFTASHTFTLPDADSFFPVYGKTITYAGPTAARTVTYPDASFSVARIDAAQTFAGAQTFSAAFASIAGVTVAGKGGVPLLVSAPAISATQTANFTASTFTPPAAVGRYRIGGVITTTSAANTGTVQLTVDYVDSQGTVHTADVIPLCDAAGSIAATKTGASKEYCAVPRVITINNAATAIVVKVVITGTVSYTIAANIEQIA